MSLGGHVLNVRLKSSSGKLVSHAEAFRLWKEAREVDGWVQQKKQISLADLFESFVAVAHKHSSSRCGCLKSPNMTSDLLPMNTAIRNAVKRWKKAARVTPQLEYGPWALVTAKFPIDFQHTAACRSGDPTSTVSQAPLDPASSESQLATVRFSPQGNGEIQVSIRAATRQQQSPISVPAPSASVQQPPLPPSSVDLPLRFELPEPQSGYSLPTAPPSPFPASPPEAPLSPVPAPPPCGGPAEQLAPATPAPITGAPAAPAALPRTGACERTRVSQRAAAGSCVQALAERSKVEDLEEMVVDLQGQFFQARRVAADATEQLAAVNGAIDERCEVERESAVSARRACQCTHTATRSTHTRTRTKTHTRTHAHTHTPPTNTRDNVLTCSHLSSAVSFRCMPTKT